MKVLRLTYALWERPAERPMMSARRSTIARAMRRMLRLLRTQDLRLFPRGEISSAVVAVSAAGSGAPVSLSKLWVRVNGLFAPENLFWWPKVGCGVARKGFFVMNGWPSLFQKELCAVLGVVGASHSGSS